MSEEPSETAAQHGEHGGGRHPKQRHDRLITIAEAVLLSLVTLAVAWSGYAAAKWSSESSVKLSDAAELRTEASRADLDAREDRNSDLSTFEAWFDAFIAGDQEAIALAERRFRPEFAVAFDAWRATSPDTNLAAPRGPTDMPEYRQPGLEQSAALDREADAALAEGVAAGKNSDNYVRATVFLASVLFLVGISTHFPVRSARYGLIALSVVVLVAALVQLVQLPFPPT
jgi:hypothetical protein